MTTQNGGAGTHTLRTSFWLKLVLSLPYYQHNLAPFVAESFHFSLKCTAQGVRVDEPAQVARRGRPASDLARL